jgi:predicted glycosyltransferase
MGKLSEKCTVLVWAMKIWYDACTGKHVRYGVAIAKRLREKGHKVILTTRKHPDTVPLAKLLNEDFIVVGKYNPKSLMSRLREGIQRQLHFCRIFKSEAPDVAISHGSVDQIRVAFGLGVPTITTLDTPYAMAVHRLTLPLVDYIVASKAIPKEALQKFNVKGEIILFDGVDEVAWIRGFKPIVKYDFGKPLIVVREIEEKAAYAKGRFPSVTLAKKLTRLGRVVYISRYRRKAVKGLIIPEGFVDSASLVAQADLFVGAGGTITREAALQGTPAIVVNVFQEQYVNDYLAGKGFPIFRAELSRVFDLAKKVLGKKKDVSDMLSELENPVDVISSLVDRLS